MCTTRMLFKVPIDMRVITNTKSEEWREELFVRKYKTGKVNFCGANLSGLDLRGYDFSHYQLRRVNFRGANLAEVDLSYADLRGADLHGANLEGATLCGAWIDGAKVSDGDIGGKGYILCALDDEEWNMVREHREHEGRFMREGDI